MTKQPWMKFYPSDWRSDAALRMCSMAARGLWMEMIAIMHNAEPYGHLTVNGVAIDQKQLSQLAGCGLRECINSLAELECSGVFSRTSDGIIFSRKMKRQREKDLRDRENGKKGGRPRVNPTPNPHPAPQILEARIQKLERKKRKKPAAEPPEFLDFWNSVPRKVGRFEAVIAYCKAIEFGADPLKINAAAKRWRISEEKTEEKYIKHPSAWLNNRRYEDYHAPPERETNLEYDPEKKEWRWKHGFEPKNPERTN